MTNENAVREILKKVIDPDLGKDIVSLGFVKEIRVENHAVTCQIELTTPACPMKDQLKQRASEAIRSLPGVESVEIRLTARVQSSSAKALLPGVKNVIVIASGKGGVGKSTVSTNLAFALAQDGARVGLMDADVYGPSLPAMCGLNQAPDQKENKLIPLEKDGVRVISTGFLIGPDEAVIWRGPLLHRVIRDFLSGVEWGELDYLLVDLPPGTGDVQLSLCQNIPVTGAVIVSTPQSVAWNVARRAIRMFEKLNVPVLGVIENMSRHVCSHCGTSDPVFGAGGVKEAAQKAGIFFLGDLPLWTPIREAADQGHPIVSAKPNSPAAQSFRAASRALAARVSVQSFTESNKPMPTKIGPPGGSTIEIEWSDGLRTSVASRQIRLACPCAYCVSEETGQRLLKPDEVPADVRALAINPVGRYAIQIQWSDGHQTGLYSFDLLRKR